MDNYFLKTQKTCTNQLL